MKWSLYLGKISGIKVFVHWSFALLLAWIAFDAAGGGVLEIVWSVAFILAIFFCVFLHELGHALAARRYGIGTQDITMLPIGGLARLEKMPDNPKQELVVALAGPMVNFVLAVMLVAWLALTGNVPDFGSLGAGSSGFSYFLFNLLSANIILAVFNLIPAFPMDGGRVLLALLSMKLSRARATKIASSVGQVLAVAFVFIGFFYNPMLIFIGIFIFLGAQAESSHVQAQSLLHTYKVADVMMYRFSTLHTTHTLAEAAKLLLEGQEKDFLVQENGGVMGTLSRAEIVKALAEQGEQVEISNIMDRKVHPLHPEMPLEEAYQLLVERNSRILPVVDNNRLVGVLDLENVQEFIMIRTAQKKNSKVQAPISTSEAKSANITGGTSVF